MRERETNSKLVKELQATLSRFCSFITDNDNDVDLGYAHQINRP